MINANIIVFKKKIFNKKKIKKMYVDCPNFVCTVVTKIVGLFLKMCIF